MDKTGNVRWGILGTGMIVGKLGTAFRLARGAELVAIASRDANRARITATTAGAARGYGGYAALIDDPEIDVILNALHNGLHCEWTIRALEAGKHVLCEKPFACSVAEAEQMFAAARAHHRFLMEAFMYRFHPQLATVRQMVDQDEIGELLELRANYLSIGRDPQNPRYRTDAGGGALLDLGCYCVNFSRHFAGREPLRVTAHSKFDRDTGVDLTTSGLLQFSGGLTAHLACSFESEGVYHAELIGQQGRILIPHPWRPPQWPAEIVVVKKMQAVTHRVDPAGFNSDPVLPFSLELEHFSDAVRENRAPQFPGGLDVEQDALANARVLEALAISARQGCTVEI